MTKRIHDFITGLLILSFIVAMGFLFHGCSTTPTSLPKTAGVFTVPLDVPEYQHFSPPTYDEYGLVNGVDPYGSPSLNVWGTGVTQLVGVRVSLYCTPPALSYGARLHHVRFIYSGTWPLVFTDGDTLRGVITRGEWVDSDLPTPQPIPDSLGTISGGVFALGVNADTLTGYAKVNFTGPCTCYTPIPVKLIKG